MSDNQVRIVPFDISYDLVRKFEKAASILLWTSAAVVFSIWLGSEINIVPENDSQIIKIKDYLKVISYCSMIGFMAMSLIAKILFHTTEKSKRNDLIDNSFGTKYSDENTSGYYNNENLPFGVKKLALNSYESSFHTENTLKVMLFQKAIYLLIIAVPFLISIFSHGGQSVIRLLCEISIPLTILVQYLITTIYYFSVKEINERFKVEFVNIGNRQLDENDYPKLLIPVMEYYNTKSWANINLDNKVFQKYNEEMSAKWVDRKKRISVE